MIKLASGILAFLCLLAATLVLWQSPSFPEKLPDQLANWIVVWVALFKNPAAAAILLSTSAILVAAAACVVDILLGILFSSLASLFALFCLLGALGSQFDPLAKSLEQLFR